MKASTSMSTTATPTTTTTTTGQYALFKPSATLCTREQIADLERRLGLRTKDDSNMEAFRLGVYMSRRMPLELIRRFAAFITITRDPKQNADTADRSSMDRVQTHLIAKGIWQSVPQAEYVEQIKTFHGNGVVTDKDLVDLLYPVWLETYAATRGHKATLGDVVKDQKAGASTPASQQQHRGLPKTDGNGSAGSNKKRTVSQAGLRAAQPLPPPKKRKTDGSVRAPSIIKTNRAAAAGVM